MPEYDLALSHYAETPSKLSRPYFLQLFVSYLSTKDRKGGQGLDLPPSVPCGTSRAAANGCAAGVI